MKQIRGGEYLHSKMFPGHVCWVQSQYLSKGDRMRDKEGDLFTFVWFVHSLFTQRQL
jgi:hypothetical protein